MIIMSDTNVDYEKIRAIIKDEINSICCLIDATYLKKDTFDKWKIGFILALIALSGGSVGLLKGFGLF